MSRFATLLLTVLRKGLPRDWADDIVRDLEEAYLRRRADGTGRLGADLWLLAQAGSFIARFSAERLREWLRSGVGKELVDAATRDLRHALRTIRRTSLSSVAIIMVFAVGIGANSAVFSVVRTVVLDPVPYEGADRLVVTGPYPWMPAPVLEDVARTSAAVEELQAFYPRRFAVTIGGEPSEMEGAVVTPDFLSFLEAEISLGRDFVGSDARPGAAPVAIVGHDAWQERFGGATNVLGRTLRIDGVVHEVVGVTGPDFRQLTPRTDDPELWIPGRLDRLGETSLPEDAMQWGIPVARLTPGDSWERAQAELQAAVARHRTGPLDGEGVSPEGLHWTRLGTHLAGPVRPALLMIQAAVALVLLLACVNVANLLLVRFGSRRGEVAVRTALGASGGRLLRALVTESVVLAVLGGAAGLLLAGLGLELILRIAPADLPRMGDVAIDGPVLLLTLVVSVGTGVIFGLLPALLATRCEPGAVLQEGGRGSVGSRRGLRLSRGLVVAEVALTVVLVAVAGLLTRSFLSLSGQPPGFRTDHVLAVPLRVPEQRFESVEELEAFHSAVLGSLAGVPGVRAVGLANNLPIERGSATRSIVVEGEDEARSLQFAVVSPGYFDALGIARVRGRLIDERDRREARPVVVVDEVMAQLVWPGEDPIGHRLRFADGDRWFTVVGVTAPVLGSGLAREPAPGFYISHHQRPRGPVELGVGRDAVLLVHTERGVTRMAPAVRRAIHAVAPSQPVPEVASLSDVLAGSVAPERFRALLLGAFAALALILAAVGIYGVVGHILSDRIHELRVRRALGATGGDVARSVLAWGLRLGIFGITLGVGGALLIGPTVEGLLFGVGATDLPTLLGSAGLVLILTVAACALPARRAAKIEVLTGLRSDG